MRVGEFACLGDGSAWSAWLDVVYLEDRRVRLRTTSRAWGGGWGGGVVGVVASRAVPRFVHRAPRECRWSVATVCLARTRR